MFLDFVSWTKMVKFQYFSFIGVDFGRFCLFCVQLYIRPWLAKFINEYFSPANGMKHESNYLTLIHYCSQQGKHRRYHHIVPHVTEKVLHTVTWVIQRQVITMALIEMSLKQKKLIGSSTRLWTNSIKHYLPYANPEERRHKRKYAANLAFLFDCAALFPRPPQNEIFKFAHFLQRVRNPRRTSSECAVATNELALGSMISVLAGYAAPRRGLRFNECGQEKEVEDLTIGMQTMLLTTDAPVSSAYYHGSPKAIVLVLVLMLFSQQCRRSLYF